MTIVDILDAEGRFLQLVEEAASGNDVVVSRRGKPLARITRLSVAKRRIKFGVLKGKITIAPDFDAPLLADVLSGFEGR